ncbi:non-hydrolyzing UDP-N-acetylglucosamine 2-epimerase [Candidatus Tisiphia endosymbiont of Nemotelus uliginosus]|uniref:non-hydrolyzing UDP-N-acetylglucosamine 2-epimerase n=1 Tax=Candidatus Tisiphia endosymbiont of Nemotelus uliginosus TaxID=3077926 RepID=UPI0035C8EF9E
MERILTIFGNRPQFIKSCCVSQALKKVGCIETVVNTGQHFDFNMRDLFFQELELNIPKYNLNINNLSDSQFIAQCIKELESILINEKPDIVLVYGDTNTTLAATITTKKLYMQLAHVEAGPRLGDLTIPEEYNRILVDHSADILFAPDRTSVTNLKREGLAESKIIFSGDVMLDLYIDKAPLFTQLQYNTKYTDYFVCTFHRQENVDSALSLKNLCEMLISLDTDIVFPLHPRTKRNLKKYGLYATVASHPKVHLEESLSYIQMMSLISSAKLVLTDSGGLQKEAFFANIPCYVFLNTTPWPEIEKLGWQKVVGTFSKSNFTSYKFHLADFAVAIENRANTTEKFEIFGNGRASEKIAETLKRLTL